MKTTQKKIIKKAIKLCLLCLVYIVFAFQLNAQSCKDVFSFCPPSSDLFNKQAFARSYKVKPTQKLQLVQVFYGGTGYHINICKKDFLGDFRIKLLDFSTKKVLWDNINDNYNTSISISFGSTQRIFMDISPLNPENFDGMSQCIGIVVRYYRDEELKDSSPPDDPSYDF